MLRISSLVAAVLLVAITWLLPPKAYAEPLALSSQAIADIAALMQEKASRTPAEKKVDSNLLLEHKRRQGDATLLGMPLLRTGAQVDAAGFVLVDIDAEITERLLARVPALGGEIKSAFSRFKAMRARIPLAQLTELAALSEVRMISPADFMMTQMLNTTEGDVAHTGDTARQNFGVDGSGVTVCAMSDSVDALATVQGSGDLPPNVTVLAGQSGNPGTSEGTALLEIIHDMAPGAALAFATGSGGEAQMAQNILDLAALGCDTIIDDVLYLGEPVFQDGIIAQAVDQVVADGVQYFTSAGNSGNLSSGNSGVHEGDYSGIALPAPLNGAGMSAHDFGGGSNNTLLTQDAPVFVTLQWSDPQGGATNDYDLFLLDAALTNVLKASTVTQDGTQNPIEAIDSQADDDTGNRLVIVKFNGDDRFLHLNTHRGRIEHGTNGQIFGHPGAAGAITIGAVNVATANGGPFTGGPANPVEFFSSDGPRRIFFNADGSPVGLAGSQTQRGTQSSVVRQKPDFVAADGVSTATPGFDPFFGTSASAPHAAAISALFQELFPNTSSDFAFDAFRSAALDIDDKGFDDVSGNGIIMSDDSFSNAIFADGFESGNTSAWTE